MQLSLSSLPSDPVDPLAALLAPVPASESAPGVAGFGELFPDLVPAPASGAPFGPADPAATEAAAAQAAVDWLAWLARTPPPPPPSGGASADRASGSAEAEAGAEDAPEMPGGPARPMALRPPLAEPAAISPWPGPDIQIQDTATAASRPAPSAPRLPAAPVPQDMPAPVPAPEPAAAAPASGESADRLPVAGPALPAALTPAPLRMRSDVRAEKIAAAARPASTPAAPALEAAEEKFLSIEEELDVKPHNRLGIGAAQSGPAMSSSFSPPSPSPSGLRLEAAAVAPSAESARAGEPPAPETPRPVHEVAHAAVAAVTRALERAETAPRTAVNLQFSIGDSDLVVRIEHRADEVRATFRTDSAELRTALAQEWQSAATGGADMALRRIEPVFTSTASAGGPGGSADDSAAWSQQRGAGREPGAGDASPSAAPLRPPSANGNAAASAPAPVRPLVLPTALHLQTFA